MAPYAQTRLPWQDRWTKPSLDELLKPMDAQQRKYFQTLIDQLDGYEDVERELIWYGDSWKWTIHYTFKGEGTERARGGQRGRNSPSTMCYLVPKTEQPLVCIPMADQHIQRLPMRRLVKYIREGIRSAKCAVATFWATWVPTARSETEVLGDLLKRKHKMFVADAQAQAVEQN